MPLEGVKTASRDQNEAKNLAAKNQNGHLRVEWRTRQTKNQSFSAACKAPPFQNRGEKSSLGVTQRMRRWLDGARPLTAALHVTAEADQDENHLTQVPTGNADIGFVQRVPECAGDVE